MADINVYVSDRGRLGTINVVFEDVHEAVCTWRHHDTHFVSSYDSSQRVH